jgi:c(7)-type cytochrome triheme protein
MLKYSLFFCLFLIPSLVSARWIEDIVIFENEDYGNIAFSHYQHLDILGKDCVLCHNQVFHIDPKKNPAFSMADMEQGKSCGACHNGDKAFSVEENCDTCHME